MNSAPLFPIPAPSLTFRHSPAVLAQVIAAHSGWQMNAAGQVFDGEGTFLAASFVELGNVVKALGWIAVGSDSGVLWSETPSGECEGAERALAVHAEQLHRSR